jgi:hypothetical protein
VRRSLARQIRYAVYVEDHIGKVPSPNRFFQPSIDGEFLADMFKDVPRCVNELQRAGIDDWDRIAVGWVGADRYGSWKHKHDDSISFVLPWRFTVAGRTEVDLFAQPAASNDTSRHLTQTMRGIGDRLERGNDRCGVRRLGLEETETAMGLAVAPGP